MLSDIQRDQLKQVLPPLQIIVAALAIGVVSFFAATLFISPHGGGVGPGSSPLLAYIGVGFAVVGLAVWTVLPNFIARQSRNSVLASDARRLAAVFQTRLIVGCDLLEGIAFLNLVAYMIEGQRISLIVAGVFLLLMISQFPTLDRIVSWVESELAEVDQLRQLEPPRGR